MTYHQLTLSGRSVFAATASLLLFALGPTWSLRAQEAAPAVNQEGMEIQARGPIHEAFADANSGVMSAGPVVPKQPPEPVNEVPPEVRPDDASAIWIPGYWAWDDERQDFLWISGVWRVPPPDAVWVPGYWTQVEGGFQWVSGFWADAEAQQVQYLPAPPASLERGPSSPAPGDDFFYIPGNWNYVNGQYVWQPGYWTAYQHGWTWSNSYYQWTPSGYVYVPGRWDVPVSMRGWAFAPVVFQPGVWSRPGFYYRPSTALNILSLAAMLFARNNGWYYYGDYYGNDYARRGYHPWYGYGGYRGAYNHLYGYEWWSRRRNDPNWDREVRDRFAENQNNPQARPPRSWKDWEERMRTRDERPAASGQTSVAVRDEAPFVRLDENANVQIGGTKGVRLDQTVKTQADQMTKHYKQLWEQRRQSEQQARADVQAGTQPDDRKPGDVRVPGDARVQGGFQLPRPPVQHRVAKPIEGAPQDQPRRQVQRPQLPQRPQGGPPQQPSLPPGQGQPRPGRPGEGRPEDDRPKLPDRTLDIPRVKTPAQQPAQGTPQDPIKRPEPMPRVEKPQTEPKQVSPPQPPPRVQPQPQPKQVEPPREQPKQARPEGGNRPPKIDVPRPQGGDRSPGPGGGKKEDGGKKEGVEAGKKKK